RLARESAGARGIAAEAMETVSRYLGDRYGERDAYELGAVVQTTLDAKLQEVARQSLERGLEDLDARQGFRGPSGHLTGKALDRRRAELKAANCGPPPREEARAAGGKVAAGKAGTGAATGGG